MAALHAQNWLEDPRVQEARRLLLTALADRQAALTSVRPSRPALVQGFADKMARFQELRGAPLFFPYLASGFGRGPLVELLDGSVKYDFITGIGVHFFGHGSPLMLEAALDACLDDTLMQGNLQQNGDAEEVLNLFLSLANQQGAHFAHGYLSTSGAMANENALKIIFQKKFPARRILAFEKNFAGRTLALSQVTDKPAYREGLPPTLSVDYLPFFDAAQPEESLARTLSRLDEYLARFPGDYAAMVLELIQGEGGGYREGDAAFFKPLLDRLRAAGIGIVFDEVQTFGRTGHPFAFQHFGLDAYAEIVTVGKMTQVCATLISDAYRPAPGLVSQTFTASTAAIKAGKRILQVFRDEDYFGNHGRISALSGRFRDRVIALAEKFPDKVQGPFGLGAMVVFTPMGGDAKAANAFLQALFQAGVIGFIAGSYPTRIRFLLPLGGITEADIDAASDILEDVVSGFTF